MRIFADGADIDAMIMLAEDPRISGFTTNPTLMRKSGVSDYEGFARKALEVIPDLPISFEVFADDPAGMIRQARLIAGWGPNVFVKIPVTNTRGHSTAEVVRELSGDGIHLNVTALMTVDQVRRVTDALVDSRQEHVISVFAGRIADTGRDPVPVMAEALAAMAHRPELGLVWASPREVLNIVQADQIGVHIITVTNDLLAKLDGFGKDLDQFSLETVRMFHDDAQAAGFFL